MAGAIHRYQQPVQSLRQLGVRGQRDPSILRTPQHER